MRALIVELADVHWAWVSTWTKLPSISDSSPPPPMACALPASGSPASPRFARGTVNSTRLQPRDVFTPALLVNAASFILAHNHPSGDPSPSSADRLVTAQIRSTAEMLGITMLDHLIVTRDRWHSFREAEGWDDRP